MQATALNEGRSLNPGDTHERRVRLGFGFYAQRRPESEPRRHRPFHSPLEPFAQRRAQRRPESEPRRHMELRRARAAATFTAQRRPESEPRRHGHGDDEAPDERQRSTKAGV